MDKRIFAKFLALGENRTASDKRTFRAGGVSALRTLMVVAAAIAAVVLISNLPAAAVKLDATGNKLYTLSAKTEQLVSAVEQDVTVYLVSRPDSEDDMLVELLDRYKDLSAHIRIERVDPVLSPNFTAQYTDSILADNSLIITSGKRFQCVSYADIYDYDYSGGAGKRFVGESRLTGAIDYVTTDILPRAYQLAGHGESGFVSGLVEAVKGENIELNELNLLTVGAVPADCRCLIVVSPKNDLSAGEADKLRSYLSGGGRMLLITEYLDQRLPLFDALMEDYGLRLVDGIVVEGSGSHSIRGYNHYLLPDIHSHIITTPLRIGNYFVLMPGAQGLQRTEAARESVSVSELLTTSDQAFAKLSAFNMTTFEWESGDVTGPFLLGAAITETVSQGQTKIVWLTSANMLLPDVDDTVSGANYELILNAVNWMCERENAIAIEGKSVQLTALTIPSADATAWSLLLVCALPLAFVVTGIAVVTARKRR